jgi:hypothetical protein
MRGHRLNPAETKALPHEGASTLVCGYDACARDIVWFQSTPTVWYLGHQDFDVYCIPSLQCNLNIGMAMSGASP